MCGECCSSWNIPIEAEKARQLLEKSWVQARLRETSRQLTPMTPDTYRIPLTDENVCVFLAEDRRCMVEANEGLALKPHECQRFPFATVRLPDGTDWHETSAACKSISEKLLLAFQPIQPRPSASRPAKSSHTTHSSSGRLSPVDESGDAHVGVLEAQSLMEEVLEAQALTEAALEPLALFPERIPVSGFRHISKAAYQEYQHQLRQLFMNPNLRPEAALAEAHRLLHRIARQHERHGGKSGLEGQPLPSVQTSGYRFSPLLAGMLTIAFLRKPFRTLSWVSLIRGRTYPDPRIFGVPVELGPQGKIPWDNSHEAGLNRRLSAFLFNLLQRKRLIALGSSLAAHLAMAGVACLLVQWYARTLAWLQGAGSPSESDVSSAIRLVERYYTGHQPRFLAFFTSRWRAEWIAALLFTAS